MHSSMMTKSATFGHRKIDKVVGACTIHTHLLIMSAPNEQLQHDLIELSDYTNVRLTNITERIDKTEEGISVLSKRLSKIKQQENQTYFDLLVKEKLTLMRYYRTQLLKQEPNQAYMERLDNDIWAIDRLIRTLTSVYK